MFKLRYFRRLNLLALSIIKQIDKAILNIELAPKAVITGTPPL